MNQFFVPLLFNINPNPTEGGGLASLHQRGLWGRSPAPRIVYNQRKLHPLKSRFARGFGFTLIELSVTMGIIAVLSTLVFSAVSTSMQKAKTVQCISKMRQIGVALLLYTNENNGTLPPSSHSCGFSAQTKWTDASARYLGIQSPVVSADFERFYRCPLDPHKSNNYWSYALNAFFELNPDNDDYQGSPQTWHRLVCIEHPARTVLLAEIKGANNADHFMPETWGSMTSATNTLAYNRHIGLSNYLFLDGHIETLTVQSVYSPSGTPNLFNPSLAQ